MKSVVPLSPWSFIIATWTHKCPPWSNLKHCCWWLNIWLTSWARQCHYPNFSRWTWLKCHPSYIFPNIAGWCFPVIRRFLIGAFASSAACFGAVPCSAAWAARKLALVPAANKRSTTGRLPGGRSGGNRNPPVFCWKIFCFFCVRFWDILEDVPTTKPPIDWKPTENLQGTFEFCKLQVGEGFRTTLLQ